MLERERGARETMSAVPQGSDCDVAFTPPDLSCGKAWWQLSAGVWVSAVKHKRDEQRAEQKEGTRIRQVIIAANSRCGKVRSFRVDCMPT